MIAQIRAELLKIRSTRTKVGLILGMVALILLFTLLTGLLTHPSGLGSKENQRQLLSLSSTAGVFSALAGVLLVTSEYRYGTIRPTFLFNPARSHVLTAKIVVGALAGLAFGILGEAIGWAIGYVILDGRGITIVLTSSDVLLLTLGGARGSRAVGRDRRRGRRDHPQPSRRSHHPARRGASRRQPPIRPRAFRGTLCADTRGRRADGPQGPSSPLTRRRGHRSHRLGRHARRHRCCPYRTARYQLAPHADAAASPHRPISRPGAMTRLARKGGSLARRACRRAPSTRWRPLCFARNGLSI
jgi:hypothetical protein